MCHAFPASVLKGKLDAITGPSMIFGGFAYNGVSFLFRSGTLLAPTYVVGWDAEGSRDTCEGVVVRFVWALHCFICRRRRTSTDCSNLCNLSFSCSSRLQLECPVGMATSFSSALYLTFTSAIIDFNLARLSPKAKEAFAATLGETLVYARRSYALCLAAFMMAFTVRLEDTKIACSCK